jgi:hypothetical protein
MAQLKMSSAFQIAPFETTETKQQNKAQHFNTPTNLPKAYKYKCT